MIAFLHCYDCLPVIFASYHCYFNIFLLFLFLLLLLLFILPPLSPAPPIFLPVSVDSYTPQDWKKLQAAVDALKSPALRDDIELDPSAIGQYLHTDYIRSLSTPNIYELQVNDPYTEMTHPRQTVPHSSTMHTFNNYALVGPAAASEQMPRKTRVPSSCSLHRHRISSMAEAGDKLEFTSWKGRIAKKTSPALSIESTSPIQRRRLSSEASLTADEKEESPKMKSVEPVKKKKKAKSVESPEGPAQTSDAVRLAKNLHQGIIVYEDGLYKEARTRCVLCMSNT